MLRLCAVDITSLSTALILLKTYIPLEFARNPRSINELDRWKATEFRMFLLYFGPIIVQKYLHIDYLKHFVLLHTAIRILCHKKDCQKIINMLTPYWWILYKNLKIYMVMTTLFTMFTILYIYVKMLRYLAPWTHSVRFLLRTTWRYYERY